MHDLIASLLAGRELADLAVVALPLVAMPLLSIRLRRIFAGTGTDRFPRLRIYLRSMLAQWLLVVCIAVLWVTRGRNPRALGLDLPLTIPGKAGLIVAAAAALALFAYLFVSLAKLDAAGRAKLLAKLAPSKIAPRTRGEAALFAPVSLTAGIAEELLYRGYLFWFLVPATGFAAAVVASAAIFGMGHLYQGWRGMLSTAGVGLVLGVLYAVTGSLWWVMILHAVIDLQYSIVGFYVAAWNRAPRPLG